MRRPAPITAARRALLGVGAATVLLATQGIGIPQAADAPVDDAPRAAATAPLSPDVQRLAALVDQAAARQARADARVFATVAGVDLVLPGEVLEVGFHETGAHFSMLALQPMGSAVANHNAGRVEPPATSAGPNYMILPSRGRDGHATSAADLVLHRDDEVLSPVTGTIVRVIDYVLYGKHPDVIIEIRPDANPDLVVQVFHVHGVDVRADDRVVAGVTTIADGARVFPFVSDVESVSGTYQPHVDVRVHHG